MKYILIGSGVIVLALLNYSAFADDPHSLTQPPSYTTVQNLTIQNTDSQAIAFAQAGANNNISAWTLKPQWSFAGGAVNNETAFSLMIGQKACKDCLLYSGSFAFDSEETAIGFGASGTF